MSDVSTATPKPDAKYRPKNLAPLVVFDTFYGVMNDACPDSVVQGMDHILQTARHGLFSSRLFSCIKVYFYTKDGWIFKSSNPVAYLIFSVDWKNLKLKIESGERTLDFDFSTDISDQVDWRISHLKKLMRSVLSRYKGQLYAKATYHFTPEVSADRDNLSHIYQICGLEKLNEYDLKQNNIWTKEINEQKTELDKSETITEVEITCGKIPEVIFVFAYKRPPEK